MIRSVGIIGLGSFGQFAASLLPDEVEVVGYDTRPMKTTVQQADLDEVMQTDAVILAIPLSAYQEMLSRIQPITPPGTLLIDVCSVKVKPDQLLKKYLPDHPNLLITHPLFGPESASPGQTAGHDLIVTKSVGAKAEEALEFCEKELELTVHRMTPEAHDQVMAQVHALTFFVARGLADSINPEVPFKTPSFQMILDLIELDSKHSNELFETIEKGNPYAQKVRQDLIKSFEKVEADLRGAS